MAKENKETRVFRGKSLRIFVSYSSEDKQLAGAIKEGFEHYGMDVFLAHEDITPSAEWQETILKRLKQTDVFIPLLTNNFKESNWTDQETGIAVANRKLIVPLRVDINPYGFIAKVQAFKFKYDTSRGSNGSKTYSCWDSCLEITKLILNKKKLRENLKDCLIRSFAKSNSFEDANKKTEMLENYEAFSKEQIEEIVKGSIENRQIYEAYKAGVFLKKFMTKYKKHINSKRKKELMKLVSSK
ncbi:MAG: hypothetical protein A2W07_02975 [candidate division Zixibacteria bacterium RBG_16_43_9]|nr:MAG: hypothetical protein A2W07_02975 [candidate division Zixibacteria bacterium RBG_16_43_9]